MFFLLWSFLKLGILLFFSDLRPALCGPGGRKMFNIVWLLLILLLVVVVMHIGTWWWRGDRRGARGPIRGNRRKGSR